MSNSLQNIQKIFANKIFLIILLGSGVVSSIILILDYLIFFSEFQLFSSIAIIALLTFTFPTMLFWYMTFKKKKEVEEQFPTFLRDFVEAVRSGLTLPQCFKYLRKNDYKGLTPYIKKISAQLDWGIPLDKALMNFAKESESRLITRIISSVIESYRFGGNFAETFESLSNTALEVDRLRQERRLYLQSQLMTGYTVFFVFLAVIIGLGKFLVPSLAEVSVGSLTGGATPPENLSAEYNAIFRNLILLQGLFAGLAVGKMAEGSVISGIKHSMLMMGVGIAVFTIFG